MDLKGAYLLQKNKMKSLLTTWNKMEFLQVIIVWGALE